MDTTPDARLDQAASQSIDATFTDIADAQGLPAPVRLGFLYTCINYVATMLSDHAQQVLGIRQYLGDLRDGIAGGHLDPTQIERALLDLESRFETAEHSGFGPEPILMVHLALQAAAGIEGTVSSALSQAAVVFACCRLWQQGVTGSDVAVSRDYIMGLEQAYLGACLALLNTIRSNPAMHTSLPGLDEIPTLLLPTTTLRKCRSAPPVSERKT